MKKLKIGILLGFAAILSGCDDAEVVSYNLSKAADNFEINRRIVFYNGITNDYMLEVAGRCSTKPHGAPYKRVAVICKIGEKEYKKHFLGLSDNVTYFVEQLDVADASAYHYRVTFKPQVILPDVDFRGSLSDGPRNQE